MLRKRRVFGGNIDLNIVSTVHRCSISVPLAWLPWVTSAWRTLAWRALVATSLGTVFLVLVACAEAELPPLLTQTKAGGIVDQVGRMLTTNPNSRESKPKFV